MILVNTSPTFRVDFGSESIGPVTVTITRADGSLLVENGATFDNGDGTYDHSLAVALNTRVDLLRLDWTVTSTNETVSTFEEVVGSLLFTIEEARGTTTTGLQTPLADVEQYPDLELVRWREHITQQFEDETSRGWVRRHCRIEAHGDGTRVLSVRYAQPRTVDGTPLLRRGRHWPTRVVAASVNGEPVDPTAIVASGGFLVREDGPWPRASSSNLFNVSVDYEYGDLLVDPQARTHGLSMILTKAQPSDMSSFATAFNNRDGSQTLTHEGGWTYPRDVWSWLKQNRRRVVFA